MSVVIDANALVAFVTNEPAADTVGRLLTLEPAETPKDEPTQP